MSIQGRLDELSPYVTTIRYGKIPIIETAFPKSWGVQENNKIAVKVVEGKSNLITNCIIYSELDDISIDDILDYVAQTIAINREREYKTALLKAKVEELKEVFNSNPLSKLQDLYFAFNGNEPEDDLELELELSPKEDKKEVVEPETIREGEVTNAELEERATKPTTKVTTKPKVELPPRKPVAPTLEDFDAPTCKCKEGQSCPECTTY
tara:strand:+ start:3338 stop:3964 length:627 start_codon:yes stop_codon:yes gene_type:complete